jgi:hypothetical protein
MQFYTRLAVFCLVVGLGARAFGQATPVTNAPVSPTLTPEAEQRARELLNQTFQQITPVPAVSKTTVDVKAQERDAARKRAEAEARRRLDEQKAKNTPAAQPVPSAQPATDVSREQRERELQRIEAEVEKAKRRRLDGKPAPEPTTPAPRIPATTPSAPAAAEIPPSSTLTPEMEAQVRQLLNQKTSELNVAPKPTVTQAPTPALAAPAPTILPPAAAPVVTPEPPAVVTPPVVATTPAATPMPSLTPEQEAAARALLNQRTEEINVARPKPTVATVPSARPAQAVIPAPEPTRVPVPAPTPAPTIAVTTPIPTTPPAPVPTLTPEQEAVAREMLNQKTAELSAARPSRQRTPEPVIVPQSAVAPPPVVQPSSVAAVPQPVRTPVPATAQQLTAEQESRALMALNQAAPQLHGAVRSNNGAKATEEPRTARKGTRVDNGNQKTSKVEPAAVATHPAGPRNKAQKLADLLEAYRADKVTPLEYHTERAKILADPNP